MDIRGDVEAVGRYGHNITLALEKAQRLLVDGRRQVVRPQDTLTFVPGAYGPNTWGSFLWNSRGTDLCLARNGEKVDAISTYGGLSTIGRATLCSRARFQDEDLTGGFDGSQVRGLAKEDVIGAYDTGQDNPDYFETHYFLTIRGHGRIDRHHVDQRQIFGISVYDCCVYSLLGVVWDGKDHNFNFPIDAIER
jgi:hypothetical protein